MRFMRNVSKPLIILLMAVTFGACASPPNQIYLDEYSTVEATLCGPSCGKLILDLVF